jgi:VWFA-related protein
MGGAVKCAAAAALLMTAVAVTSAQDQQGSDTAGFRFRSGVELINVAATVSDRQGRFVSGLRQEDFRLYEDGALRPITHFTSERVPVSLGILLDTSSSMEGEKMAAAKQALQRLLFDLLGPEDEVFLYRFDNIPQLVQDWTTDRERVWSALRRLQARGATTLYDGIAQALPLAAKGRHRKKALLIISDGNDSSSYTKIDTLKSMIHESEVLVYAIGIDAMPYTTSQPPRLPWFAGTLRAPFFATALFQGRGIPRPRPFPIPLPRPGGPRGPITDPRDPRYPVPDPRGPAPRYPGAPSSGGRAGDEPLNLGVLREITEHSGGRTEVLRHARDLDRATGSIADELSRQYFLGYPAAATRDGRWHSIRLEVIDNPDYIVRARRGYVATP